MSQFNTRVTDVPQNDTGLPDALQAFEKALATPVIEGEMVQWGRAVEQAWDQLASRVRDALEVTHRKQMKEIAETDPEMFKRVEEIDEEDRLIRAELESLSVAIPRLMKVLPIAERDPAADVNDELKKLVDSGLAFVVRVRKQEVVVQTWLLEAFNRERGGGD